MTVYNDDAIPVYKGLVKAVMPLRVYFRTDTAKWYKDELAVTRAIDSINQLYAAMEVYTRKVLINTFGVSNCDAFVNRTDRVDVAARVEFDVPPAKDQVGRMSVYFLGSDKKTVVTWNLLSLDGHYKIIMIPDTNACIFSLYPDGHAAILSRQDFKKLDLQVLSKPGANSDRVFHLKRLNKPFTTAKDISDLLGS